MLCPKPLETIDERLKARQEKLCGELRELQQQLNAIQAMEILSALKKSRRSYQGLIVFLGKLPFSATSMQSSGYLVD